MYRFLAHENMPPIVINALRLQGFDVVSVFEIMRSAKDNDRFNKN